ncbi:ferritin family protein [Methanoculleus sp. YWC-01]|jgi:rubrerythrin|uniref:Ferritin family protein n=1 Tax=Methanoculleus nereidis TaxID=2735141 RepID=A0ABU3Z2V0_9EURY|nr:ferritin family protein [Methanoculleus sp. YWC-01]MCK9299138.1 ferritin family protein [Methanoculleus sp.]MDV4343142.1 ferritin family protein [Methanoculleus sp. YWC-01]PKL55201.1 MAG: ferritin [Methanomicrobiales archaeon HGW-Methanomicrobiales-6]
MNSEDFQKIITNAIDSEVESYTFYRSVADRVKDANLKTLFLDLAEDEKGHREYLQGLLLRDVNQMHFVAARDYKITDSIEEPELSVDMKPLDGLVLAIKKELQAAQMYTQLAAASADAEQQTVFVQLANMEKGHKARLEDIYTNMAYPEAW